MNSLWAEHGKYEHDYFKSQVRFELPKFVIHNYLSSRELKGFYFCKSTYFKTTFEFEEHITENTVLSLQSEKDKSIEKVTFNELSCIRSNSNTQIQQLYKALNSSFFLRGNSQEVDQTESLPSEERN